MSKLIWNENNIGSQKNSVIVITGGNAGIGFEQANVLANKGATIILAVRNVDYGKAAIEKIKKSNRNATVDTIRLDLSDLDSVQSFSHSFNSKYDKLDVLINNAGVMMPPEGKTKQDFELQFGVNHLGHYALTGLLLPTLLKTNKSRIITVSSLAHGWKGATIYFDNLHWEGNYNKTLAYCQSKLANLLFTYELDRRLKNKGYSTLSLAAHPGWSTTNLQNHLNFFAKKIVHLLSQSASMGALPILRAATDNNVIGGEYFGPPGKLQNRGYPIQVKSSDLSHDQTLAKRLWDVSAELTGIQYL
ncbi:oxidoreductase [Paenibacillus sp. L3-i20]|uniref:oxidoreductase n=1 Tax=Paenibacillus sp. L3-i20 TaxID=2905833 RepID=UPI001EDF603B|nr:oxidoreductase [Paenibacillus sp. L3-i20]